ncbi:MULTISPECIES: hypothetical protein [Actinoalloteichus]|uniref:Uncharacterized protein n=1 Tax=Actinoalloteichus fjordicus TaxID=1612552 RepID=A0AAC9LDI5_9PSEU|nr:MULTISPECIES: hypothetical protein [Actinoalloteichus]APU15978.1 hypothetical protein UA74_19765 [Actinoalloteichus fjordicus]APU22042.1 hypothetical protein UA75_20265 [Actinoalloteichus sp. GBA129-24]
MLKPWMKKRPDETEQEAFNRRSRTCYFCPREDKTVAESLEHEKEHETPRNQKTDHHPEA